MLYYIINMISDKCVCNKQISCTSILEGEFTTIDGTKFTATMSATGSGDTCESAKENSTININKTLQYFIKTYKPKIIDEIHTITTSCDGNCGVYAPLPNYPDTKNPSSVVTYNPRSLLVKGIYNNVGTWQGMRYLGENTYLITGTTLDNSVGFYDGVIYIGNINCTNGEVYILNVPDKIGGFYKTSIYGPNYDLATGVYTFVGTYISENNDTKGFIYSGNLSLESLTNPDNFQFNSVIDEFQQTYFHSNSGNFLVGNSLNTTEGFEISYLINFKIPNSKPIIIKYPSSLLTTTYGIWHNGDDDYVIVGGYTFKIYTKNPYNDIFFPYTGGFIVNYNSFTNIFSNWTTVVFPELGDVFIHLEGIERIGETNTYSIAATVANVNLKELSGYYLTINRNPHTGEFIVNNNWINIFNNLKKKEGYVLATSVSNNCVVGLLNTNNIVEPFQSSVLLETDISLTNNYSQTVIAKNENIKFDKTIIYSNVTYEPVKSIFTFIYDGLYIINLNIYLQNLKLPAAIFTIYYTVNKKEYNFTISQKGMDKDKKSYQVGTIHGISLPCSFSSNFVSGDILYVRNMSDGKIAFSSNYIKNSIGSLISITKVN